MPSDPSIDAELLSTCSALGCTVKGTYQKSSDCIECLKDLIRYLKRDDEDHSVLRQLGSIKLLQTDLLPILKQYNKQKQILDLILRLLVILTNPALLLYKEELPDDKLSSNIYLEIVSYLQSYKEVFTDVGVWSVLNTCLQDLLQNSYAERDEDDRFTVERILIVVRNVLHVTPDYHSEKRTDDDVNVHDQVLWALHMSGMEDLLLYLSGSEDEDQYCLHVLEIISLMLREHKPETLACAGGRRSTSQKETDEKQLMALRKKEELLKAQKIRTLTSSRFSGAFYVKNMKSISEREYISHKLITETRAVSFDAEKSGRRRPKNRLPATDNDICRRSTLSVCLFLKNFCAEFLNNSYNLLMSLVKKTLSRERTEDHDESYYLWAMSYFMEFNRLSDFQLGVVSETISVQSFHYIQTQLDTYYEMMLSDKKKAKVWSKRMHLGLKSYKELLMTLLAMSNSQDETVVRCANVIKGNIFYVMEYREMLLTLLNNFDEVKFSLAYLKDLVEATHAFLRMLDKYGKKHSHLVVQKKVRKQTRRKKKAVPDNLPSDDHPDGWEAIAGKLSAVLQGRGTIPSGIIPFDATSELSIDAQKTEAVYKIFDALDKKQVEDAVALLRSAREVWPEDNVFGSPDVDPEEEFLALREIFSANLRRDPPVVQNEEEEEELPSEDEENEEIYSSRFSEQQLNLDDFFKRFASPKVVQPYCLLMANYKKNSQHTNNCIVKMLHRIAWDCKMHGLLFQASIFLVFQKILNDPDQHFDPSVKELARLAKYVINKFFFVAEKNKKMFLELLFWKGPREVYEMEEGYGSYSGTSSKAVWTEDDDEELRYLYEENKNAINDGEDVVEVIRKLMKNKYRTNRQIIHKLKAMNLIDNAQSLHPKNRPRNEWQEEETLELQHLFEEYKSSDDIMGNLLAYMTVKKSKQSVINKLLELHLIADRKELRKKRARKETTQRKRRTPASESESGSESEFSDENDQNMEEKSDLEAPIQLKDKNEWEEQELEELRSLYEQHKDSSNCIESVASELSFNVSIHSVVSKLTELGLVNPDDENIVTTLQNAAASSSHHKVNRPHATKNTQKKRSTRSKEWQESEIVELSHLFQHHKESGDVMQNILTNLTIKRPRKYVVEKLLELGLVSDVKDLRKKRASTKTNKSKPTPNENCETGNVLGVEDSDADKPENSKSRGLALEKLKRQKEQKKKKDSRNETSQNSRTSGQQSEMKDLQNTVQDYKRKRHLILGESDSSDDETLSSIKSSLSGNSSQHPISEATLSSKSNDVRLDKKTRVLDSDSSEDETLMGIRNSLKTKQRDEHHFSTTSEQSSKTEGLSNTTLASEGRKRAIVDDSDSSDNEALSNLLVSRSRSDFAQPGMEVKLSDKGDQNINDKRKRKRHAVLDSDSSEDETLIGVKNSVKTKQSDETHFGASSEQSSKAEGLSNTTHASEGRKRAIVDDGDSSDNEALSNLLVSESRNDFAEPSMEVKQGDLRNADDKRKRKRHSVLDSDSSEDELLSEVKNSVNESIWHLLADKRDSSDRVYSDVNSGERSGHQSEIQEPSSGETGGSKNGVGKKEKNSQLTVLGETDSFNNGVLSEVNLNGALDAENSVVESQKGVPLRENDFPDSVVQTKVSSVLKDRNVVQGSLGGKEFSENVTLDEEKNLGDHTAVGTLAKENRKRDRVGDESNSSEDEMTSRKNLKRKRLHVLDDSD